MVALLAPSLAVRGLVRCLPAAWLVRLDAWSRGKALQRAVRRRESAQARQR